MTIRKRLTWRTNGKWTESRLNWYYGIFGRAAIPEFRRNHFHFQWRYNFISAWVTWTDLVCVCTNMRQHISNCNALLLFWPRKLEPLLLSILLFLLLLQCKCASGSSDLANLSRFVHPILKCDWASIFLTVLAVFAFSQVSLSAVVVGLRIERKYLRVQSFEFGRRMTKKQRTAMQPHKFMLEIKIESNKWERKWWWNFISVWLYFLS